MSSRSRRLVLFAFLSLVPASFLIGCAASDSREELGVSSAGCNLGTHEWPVASVPWEAQRHFNDGVIWMYSFNHDEAIRSFQRAIEKHPPFALAWWGIALCHGPHINNPAMDEARSNAAWAALQEALKHAANASPMEQALIAALAARYADPAAGSLPLDPGSRAPLDKAYANAMARVHAQFPTSTEVATLYAESLMDLRPWDLWSQSGEPRPETGEILRLLEQVLAADPDHPGANHLYIHAVEASRNPERADAAATRLRTLVPGSGHMVHMPAHIDVRLGRWNLAAEQNQRAIRVHDEYLKTSPTQGFYRVYMLHNDHFLAYACLMAGRKADALAAARSTIASIPEPFYRDFAPIADAYTPIEIETHMRFGEWDAILKLPEPRECLPITRSIWRFARGVSLAAKGDTAQARAEQKRFREYVAAVPSGAMMAANPAATVLRIADEMLEGEILYRERDLEGAVKHLKAAVEIEDTLNYMEPPDWVQPVRHALGAILLEADRPAEAAEVYRDDLKRWPENGWSLFGLSEALSTLGRTDEATEYRHRYKQAFSKSDIDLHASCLCAQKARAAR